MCPEFWVHIIFESTFLLGFIIGGCFNRLHRGREFLTG